MNEKKTVVITITNQKGGVGKTTTAAALMAGLNKRGKKCLTIDLDPQSNLTYLVKANTSDYSIREVFSDDCDIDEAIQQTENGDFIQSNKNLIKTINDLNPIEQVYKLKTLLESIQDKYDFIILDTPPTLSPLTMNALSASTNVIIPVQPDSFSLQGAVELSKTIEYIKKINNELTISGILFCRYKARASLAKHMEQNFDKFAKTLNTNVFQTKIREAIAVQEAQYLRENIFDYSKSSVSEDYNSFIDEFIRGL